MDDNSLDLELSISVGDFFRLNKTEMNITINEVLASASQWKKVAAKIGLSRSEQEMIQGALRVHR